MNWITKIFQDHSSDSFGKLAKDVFDFQASKNLVYQAYLKNIGCKPNSVKTLEDIPFIPVELFKSHKVCCNIKANDISFLSSGTLGLQSKHIVQDLSIYESSFIGSFEYFYGKIEDYTILALLPSYIEREGSSLIYMCEKLIQISNKKESGFYLDEHEKLIQTIEYLESNNRKTILLGVSFALMDLIEKKSFQLKNTIVMETGGMKGWREEIIREKLHQELKKGFGVKQIHSEYGMTELLSQAYSKGNGCYKCPPWMKVSFRDVTDPLSTNKKQGGINIIDLANIYSCSFIATQDLGKMVSNNCFEVLGRYDQSDVRGCNLLTQ